MKTFTSLKNDVIGIFNIVIEELVMGVLKGLINLVRVYLRVKRFTARE